MDTPNGIKVIYDLGPGKLNRYTVFYSVKMEWGIHVSGYVPFVALSENPLDPREGYRTHGAGKLGPQNGVEIEFTDLPRDCQAAVLADLNP